MSTPQLFLPGPRVWTRALGRLARRVVRGPEGDPWWSRPGLIAVSAVATVLVVWELTVSGYGNLYYADAALAASKSWTAFFTNAADLSGFVSLDKGPLSDWMMGLSGRVFGFSSLSMLLPNALCGVGAVLLLHDLVRRTLGHRVALLAALMLALSPVSVVMARYNNPDALLVLLLVASAWALVRALESGRLLHIVLCGVLVGLAFNTKMLEAYLIVPSLALAFLLGASGGAARRLGHLLAGAAAMVFVSGSWYLTMMLIPVADRPFVGDSTNNSWWQLILGANGVLRVTGTSSAAADVATGRARAAGGSAADAALGGGHAAHMAVATGGGSGGSTGPLRLFGEPFAGQIAWLLPLALLGLAVGLWLHRGAPHPDRRRATIVLFGLWVITGYVVFSFSHGTFHAYYTSVIAPPVAALAAAAVVTLVERVRASTGAAALFSAAIAGTAVLSFAILAHTPTFLPALRVGVLVGGAIAAIAILLARASGRALRRPITALALGASTVAVLAGPAAYSIATVGHAKAGTDPRAGPARVIIDAGRRRVAPVTSRISGARARAVPDALPPDLLNSRLVKYLERHRGDAQYLVAATGSQTAAPIGLASGAPIITMGGFGGADPSPTVAQMRQLVRTGDLRFVLLDAGLDRRVSDRSLATPDSFSTATSLPSSLRSVFGVGGLSPSGTSPFDALRPSHLALEAGSAVSTQRSTWVQSHCTRVSVRPTGGSARGSTAGASRQSVLYECTPAGVSS